MADKLATGTLYLATSQIIFMAAGYFTNIALGRHFGPVLYGSYGVIISLMTALNIMQVSGVPQALSKFIAEKKNDTDSILASSIKVQLSLTFVLMILMMLAAWPLSRVFHDPNFTGYLIMTALVFPLYGLFALFGGYYNGLQKFSRQALMNSIYSVSKAVLVVALSFAFKLYGAILGFIISPLISLLFGFHKPESSTKFSTRRLFLFSIPLVIFAVVSTLQFSVDLFFVRALSTPEQAGFYTAAQNIAIIPFLALSAIGQVLFPNISHKASTGQLHAARRTIEQAFRYLLLLIVPIALLLAVTAGPIINLLYSGTYAPARSALVILLAAYSMLAVFALFASALNGAGKAKLSALFAGCGILVTAILCSTLIKFHGIDGAAIASAFGASTAALLSLIAVAVTFKFSLPIASIIRVGLAGLLIIVMSLGLDLSIFWLPVYYVAAIALYYLVLKVTREITTADISHAKTLLPDWLPFVRY